MPRHTRNQVREQPDAKTQEQRETVTRSGRVSRPPTRYDNLEFLPGSNNRFTRGRPIDRSFSAKGGHSENYVHQYTPRVVEQEPIDDITLFSDDTKFIAEVLANTFTKRDRTNNNKQDYDDDNDHEDPDWNPNDDDPDATESDNDMEDDMDDVVEEGCESEVEVEEPDSDILEDADYESDNANDDMDDDSEDEDEVRRWKKWNERNQQQQNLQVVGKRCRIYRQ
jgi:hypothetical protein